MNQRFISVLIFAFVVAAGASFMLYRLMASRITTKAAPSSVQVVLAARKLDLGTVLRDADLKSADWPGTPPPGAVLKKDDLIGRGVISTIYESEPVLETRLAPKGAGGGLSATIPKGMRAVAVRVNEVVGVAGFVVPGMRVDVLISGTPPNQAGVNSNHVTRTLLQNIEVLSAGQEYKKDAEGKPIVGQVVNLLVTPVQAEQLSLATSQTSIQLVLRNPLDTEIAKTPGTAMQKLFFGGGTPDESETPVKRPAPRRAVVATPPAHPVKETKTTPFVMEIFQGGKKSESKFAEGAGEAR
ncbi:MAG TPA: Flp pilus assembly protein CpaB [Bryobacteraceae bacterium]|nr:Flp pilus assembly protein CpaB [Bryobacteraceae bacterium]